MVELRDILSERMASIFILLPLVTAMPVAILTFISIITPWWRSERVVVVPTDVPGVDYTVRSISEISLWSHIGCNLNETWPDICGLSEAECIPPQRPPEGYKPPWTPPPDSLLSQTTQRPTAAPYISTKPPDTTPAPAYLCVAGSGCKTPPPTTTVDPKELLPPVRSQGSEGGGQYYGDPQARNPVEATSSNEDGARLPVTDAPPLPPTDPPEFEPEVLPGAMVIRITTNLPTNPPPKSLISAFSQGGIKYENELTEKHPLSQPRPSGPPPSPPYVGVQMAMEHCPPDGEDPAFYDKYAPPAGWFICELKNACGKMLPIRFMLFAAEGLSIIEVGLLLIFGFLKNPKKAHFVIEAVDVVLPYVSVLVLSAVVFALLAALVSAGAVGLPGPGYMSAEDEPAPAAVHTLEGAGATCSILSLVLALLGFVLGASGVFMRVLMSTIAASDAALAAEAAEYAQAQLEVTEEWKLEQDEVRAMKKPQPIGWRAMRVAPEPEPKFALQDFQVQPAAEAAASATASGTPWTLAVGSLAATPRELQATVLALEAPGPQPQAETRFRVSLPVRAANEEAPSQATEACVRNFLASGEGAVYAQHMQQPSTTPASTARRREEEWVPKTSRQNGMTYYVNAETGETRWTPPSSAREAWSSGAEDMAGQASPSKPPDELWKKKRLKSGLVISVRAT
eukprot:TRINITY_DN31019_c0_g1_i1.p1 TRINITY_DN31019_c0_g1~~TRINITY_DN31019_c0_g1_i1.p1  ORF type:complete len:710 (+),score=122.31 TRINITY_DN31019_c0_g1_i1:87-2132(+)